MQKFFKNFYFHFKSGFDIHVNDTWYGFHWYYQSNPLFDIINAHKKCNTIHEYGVIILGLWLYIKFVEDSKPILIKRLEKEINDLKWEIKKTKY